MLSPRMRLLRKIAVISISAVAGVAIFIVTAIYVISAWKLSMRYDVDGYKLRVAPVSSMAAEGERLAHVHGCVGCHGDLTGHTFVDRLFIGRLTAPNLTRLIPHYTDAQIEHAVRGGIRSDGTGLIFMPSSTMVRISDADIAAIIAYLRTVKPRPDNGKDSSFGIMLRGLIVFGEIPLESNAVNRKNLGPIERPTNTLALGSYLAHSVCSTCHGADLHGDENTQAPDLRAMVAAYSLNDFKVLLSTGKATGRRELGLMSEVARSGLRYLRADEVTALYVYLSKPEGNAAHQ